jgi:hypothetical protein
VVSEDRQAVGGDYRRSESEAETLDRNYDELLQELRVAQTGVQILFAFLLGIAFQQRFASISTFQRSLYVLTLLFTTVSMGQLIAPVVIHRTIFRRRRKDILVAVTNRLALGGVAALMLAVLGAVLLILDYVLSPVPAALLWAAVVLLLVLLWIVLPMRERSLHPPAAEPPPDERLK